MFQEEERSLRIRVLQGVLANSLPLHLGALLAEIYLAEFTIIRFTTQFNSHLQKLRSGGNSREYSLNWSTGGIMPNKKAQESSRSGENHPYKCKLNKHGNCIYPKTWLALRARTAMRPNLNLIQNWMRPFSVLNNQMKMPVQENIEIQCLNGENQCQAEKGIVAGCYYPAALSTAL
ncbi:hypothetical protein DFP72DRAFT_1048532 [Ephemerocybe angulata]|uniref:Uncharacterized protein n=1 Tax=Ephemerocybe angulata TaxID=980116 RepID=A0A8H6M1P8_9AGAR|nr:hypothetical protein DFP72DRAFT_1048532 [Tulosesus angulatus]